MTVMRRSLSLFINHLSVFDKLCMPSRSTSCVDRSAPLPHSRERFALRRAAPARRQPLWINLCSAGSDQADRTDVSVQTYRSTDSCVTGMLCARGQATDLWDGLNATSWTEQRRIGQTLLGSNQTFSDVKSNPARAYYISRGKIVRRRVGRGLRILGCGARSKKAAEVVSAAFRGFALRDPGIAW